MSPTFDFALLNQGYVLHHGDWNFGPICSSFSRIYLVTKGEAEVTISGKRHTLSPGHLYLIPSFVTHYDACEEDFGHYYLHFADRSLRIIDFYRQYELPFQIDASSADSAMVERLMVLCPEIPLPSPHPKAYDNSPSQVVATRRFQTLPLGVRMEVNGLLLQLLSRFFGLARLRHDVSDKRIANALYAIGQDLAHPPSIGQLASTAGLGKDRFIRLFRNQTGYTPTDYIIRQRIHQAQIYFVGGQRSVKEVALTLGYDNISYFGRLFKKVTDVSPLEFIRQNE